MIVVDLRRSGFDSLSLRLNQCIFFDLNYTVCLTCRSHREGRECMILLMKPPNCLGNVSGVKLFEFKIECPREQNVALGPRMLLEATGKTFTSITCTFSVVVLTQLVSFVFIAVFNMGSL